MFNIYELLNYLNRHNSDKTYSKSSPISLHIKRKFKN